jgi:biotin-(acetyl-CoA carboxylase) ligase
MARGVDPDGALRVEHGGVIHRIIGGEVSVRAGRKA